MARGEEVVVDSPLGEAKRLRPTTAFIYLVEGEIPPEVYPEFALEEVRRARRMYHRQHVVKRRPLEELRDRICAYTPGKVFRCLQKLIAAREASPVHMPMIPDDPPFIVFLRALS